MFYIHPRCSYENRMIVCLFQIVSARHRQYYYVNYTLPKDLKLPLMSAAFVNSLHIAHISPIIITCAIWRSKNDLIYCKSQITTLSVVNCVGFPEIKKKTHRSTHISLLSTPVWGKNQKLRFFYCNLWSLLLIKINLIYFSTDNILWR